MINPLGSNPFISSTSSARRGGAEPKVPASDSQPTLPAESFRRSAQPEIGSELSPKTLSETKPVTIPAVIDTGMDYTPVRLEPTIVDPWGLSTPPIFHSHGPVVAVIDTGFQADHPDLRDHVWRSPGEVPGNGIDNDGNGTHVAGIIVGAGSQGLNVSENIASKLMDIKIFNATEESGVDKPS